MAVFTPLPERDARRLCQEYDLGTFTGLHGIAKGSVNTNYRLETEAGAYFVRIDERRAAADLEYEAALIHHLVAKGFPAPKPLTDRDGAVQRSFAGKPLMVFPFLPGADKPADDYSLDDLRACGAILADLHASTADFRRAHPNRFGFETIRTWWEETETDDQEAAELIDTQLKILPAELARSAAPKATIHADLFPDNILFDSNSRITGIIDFEAACTDAVSFDIAVAINALAWPDGVPEPNPARIDALLEGYGTEVIELELYLRLTSVRFLVTRIRDFVLTPTPAGGRVDKDYRDYVHRLRWWA